jgi:MSHA pilin protein MshD
MCAERRRRGASRGFTLPEAVIAIVVIGVGLAGILLAFSTVARSGADPLVRRQMSTVATQLLEEIMLKPYATAANSAPVGCARDSFNDVSDYNGYSASGVCTVDGVAVAELASYAVSVSVTAAALSTVAAAKRIRITVTRGGESLTVVSWRTDYAS